MNRIYYHIHRFIYDSIYINFSEDLHISCEINSNNMTSQKEHGFFNMKYFSRREE